MSTTSTVLKIILPLAFFLIVIAIIFGGSGLFNDAKEAILSAKDFLPKLSLGLEEQKADVTIPDAHREEVTWMTNTIFGMLKSGNDNCFANYGIAAQSEAKTTLTFVRQENQDKTTLKVESGAGGKQQITTLHTDFPVMKLCVIAGPDREADNFFYNFIEQRTAADAFSGTEGGSAEDQGQGGAGGADSSDQTEDATTEDVTTQLRKHYFREVSSLVISYSEGKRTISVPDLSIENEDIEDQGWLFTPEGEHICFFPTNSVTDYSESGIDNNYFTAEEANSIPNNIKNGKLRACN